MPLVIPSIDTRSYRQILDEALARIPAHNPEWTNFNESDPGVTLVQLFAFMTESMLYRANLIPERNRLKFLSLLGVPLRPAAAARGLVTFSNERGPLRTFTFGADLELLAGQVPFRTQNGLDVLPIESVAFYKQAILPSRSSSIPDIFRQLYSSQVVDEELLIYYETMVLEPPAGGAALPEVDLAALPDRSLWLALLARSPELVAPTREAIAGRVLTLGILPAPTSGGQVLPQGGTPALDGPPALAFELPRVEPLAREAALRALRYAPLNARADGDLLSEPGTIQLMLPGVEGLGLWPDLEPLDQGVGEFPPSLEDSELQERIITWLRIRLPEESERLAEGAPLRPAARLSYVGVNAARVEQRTQVASEFVGQGSGEPDQSFALVNTPVLPESVRLTVNGVPWRRVDDLLTADPELAQDRRPPSGLRRAPLVNVYVVDRESGRLDFGSGASGGRPPRGAIIQASYDYGGGRQGMVGIGAISRAPTLPAGLKVRNPIPTWGGDEGEGVAQGEAAIPRFLRHRDRLVTTEDFRDITLRTPAVDLGRVEVLPLFHPALPGGLAQGVVTVLVIPRYDPAQPDAPIPDQLFLTAVCEHLDPRRLVTTEVHVRGPEYVKIWVSAGIEVITGRDVAPVREAVAAALRSFISPLTGGFDGTGWPLERDVEALDLWAVAARVDGVARVNQVLLAGEQGDTQPTIPIGGLALPRLMRVAVQLGDPQTLAQLRGDAPPPAISGRRRFIPVPVTPEEC